MSDIERLRTEYARRAERLSAANPYALTNPDYLFTIQQRQRAVLRMLNRSGLVPLNPHRVLEIGCGSGGVIREFLSYGARDVHGIDIRADSLRIARENWIAVPLACANAEHLPYPADRFDLVLQFTAFSSILDDAVHMQMVSEIRRVLRKPGKILWYDFWLNPGNPQTRGMQLRDIQRLFPGCRIQHEKITLAPPAARRIVGKSWLFASLMEKFKIFNSHILALISPDE